MPGFAVTQSESTNQVSLPSLIGCDVPGHPGDTEAAGKCLETLFTLLRVPPPPHTQSPGACQPAYTTL